MIAETEKIKIADIAKQYKVKRIFLFGSGSLPDRNDNSDIDLAVEGISPKDFFKFYGELIFSLRKQIDLVDLSFDSKFNNLIRNDGIVIYG